MELRYTIEKHTLQFKRPAKTSRNIFEDKLHWIVKVWDASNANITGTGEAAPIAYLSPDYTPNLEENLAQSLDMINAGVELQFQDLADHPSVKFALETALLDLKNGGKQRYFESDYLNGKPIPINGLVWMNTLDEMLKEAEEKIASGFKCIKFKVGSHDFDAECRLIEHIRKLPSGSGLEIRLDANGAFLPGEAAEQLKELSKFNIHSIEQPIKKGMWDEMARLCRDSQLDIALDEELIGIDAGKDGKRMMDYIQPQYLILKPGLLGGFDACDKWIELAQRSNSGWWATSMLESNIGLNAIAQWVATHNPQIAQGLGTGMLYTNNFAPCSFIEQGELFYKM